MTNNPIHRLIELLNQFIRAFVLVHHSSTTEMRNQTEPDWIALSDAFWKRFRFPSFARRALADPLLSWCSVRGSLSAEYIETIEAVPNLLIHLALSNPTSRIPFELQHPEVRDQWESEIPLIDQSCHLADRLQRLAALTGDPWQGDNLLPWETRTPEPSQSILAPEKVASIDSRPESPKPPDPLIEAAMRAIPQTLADMDNEQKGSVPAGEKVVRYSALVRELGAKCGHGKAASEWAIHRVAERGMLSVQYSFDERPSSQGRNGVWGGGESYEVHDLQFSWLETQPALWVWWHALVDEQTAHGNGASAAKGMAGTENQAGSAFGGWSAGYSSNSPIVPAPPGTGDMQPSFLTLTEGLPATLADLLDWLSTRVRWLRSWHLADAPKPIPPLFLEVIVRTFPRDPGQVPTEPEALQSWANERLWRFSEITLHQTHTCLEQLGILDTPALPSLNPLTNERCLIEALDQLTALRSFVAQRAGTSAEGAQELAQDSDDPVEPKNSSLDRTETAPQTPIQAGSAAPVNESTAQPTKRKRSTSRGEARLKIISGLSDHHQYTEGSCLNTAPIGVNELAGNADVSPSTVSKFFQDNFKGYDRYRGVCKDVSLLAVSIKQLRGEFPPHILFGRNPAGEGPQEDE